MRRAMMCSARPRAGKMVGLPGSLTDVCCVVIG